MNFTLQQKGYIRIILALIAFMRYYQPVIFFWCYLTSFLLDAADGYVARLYNHCISIFIYFLILKIKLIEFFFSGSRFGSILDMVTDRFATAILVMILSYLYYDYRHTCMILIVLDISSHWFRVVASLLTGRGHKSIKASNSIFIRILHNYYHSRLVLSVVCLGNELFYIFAYMNYYAPAWKIFEGSHPIFFYLMILCFPVFLYKQILSLIQLQYSAVEIVEWELENDHNNPLI